MLLLRGASPAEAARLAEEAKRHEEARKEKLVDLARQIRRRYEEDLARGERVYTLRR